MKTLILVEAGSKARHIQQFLGSDYILMATVGHFREMPMPNSMSEAEKSKYGQYAQEVDNGFVPLYKVSPDKKKIVSDIKAALKKVDELGHSRDRKSTRLNSSHWE